MGFEDSTVLPSIRRLLFAAIGVAFAWVLLSLLLGLGSSHARADEADDRGAVAGIVNSVVDKTTNVVTDAATTAGHVVDAVTTAVPPAPAPPVVAPIAKAGGSAAPAVTSVVRAVVTPGVVAPVVRTVTSTVVAIPVVGAVASGLGLDTALPTVAEGADQVLIEVTRGLTGAVDTLVPVAVVPESPTGSWEPPAGPPHSAASTSSPVIDHPAADPFARFAMVARVLAAGVTAVNTFSPSAALDALASSGAPAPFGPSMPTETASLGPLGAGPGVWGALALVALVAYRAWVRRAGPEDDHAPAAPVLGTDVSPD